MNYKFGGKELQKSGMYDSGERTHIPDVERWFNIDPLAELRPDITPYRFAFNNHISFTDADGINFDKFYFPILKSNDFQYIEFIVFVILYLMGVNNSAVTLIIMSNLILPCL